MEERSRELVIELSRLGPPTLQIASDLHLEFMSEQQQIVQDTFMREVISPKAQVLALLGDIGIPTHPFYKRFLLHQAEQFEAVLVLAGNHEFYDVAPPGYEQGKRDNQTWSEFYKEMGSVKQSVRDMKMTIATICEEHPRLHFVDNTRVRLGLDPGSVTLLCSTLWSNIPEDAMGDVGMSMNDYRMIYTSSESDSATKDLQGVPVTRLTPENTCQWHAEAVGWLHSEISQIAADGCHCIGVLTHHTPSMRGTSAPEHETPGNLLNHAFSTDLNQLLRLPSVKLWAYGHTHFNNDQLVHGTRLVSNQHGYLHEKDESYRSDFVIDMSAFRDSDA